MESYRPLDPEVRRAFEEYNLHLDRMAASLRADLEIVKELHSKLNAQFRIIAAGLVENGSAMLRIGFRRSVKQVFDLRPTFRIQTAPIRFASGYEARLPPSSNPAAR